MADDVDKTLWHWRDAGERGTWREARRRDFRPWVEDLDFGFPCGDGRADIIRAVTQKIAVLVGGPARAPELRAVPLNKKLGQLRVYRRGLPETQAAAVQAAITRAEEKRLQICEACRSPSGCVHHATASGLPAVRVMPSTETRRQSSAAHTRRLSRREAAPVAPTRR